MIEVQRLTKLFGNTPVVREVSFSVSAGTLLMLVGGSGSGKTSTLKTINRLIEPTSGTVLIEGQDVSALTGHVLRRGIGYVFQKVGLFPHMTVDANLNYGAARESGGTDISYDRVVEVLELRELLGRRPGSLSGGQRQRVALGRALLSRPELLLMDEPLAALDEELKSRILVYLQRVIEEWHIPTLFVSHGQTEVRRLAEWVYVVDAGRITGQGRPSEALPDTRHDVEGGA